MAIAPFDDKFFSLESRPDLARRVPVSAIKVDREGRQRRNLGDLRSLVASIRRTGVLQAIVVTEDLVLVAGERRLESCRAIDPEYQIPIRFVEELTPIEAQIMELEENLKRSELSWQNQTSSIGRIHELYKEIDPDWTQSDTARACSLSQGQIAQYLGVAPSLADERIVSATSLREAYNTLKRREQRASGDALQELLETTSDMLPLGEDEGIVEDSLEVAPSVNLAIGFAGAAPAPKVVRVLPERYPPVEQSILQESFLHWAPKYRGPKFNLIHCDFPYGINVFAGPQGGRPTAGDEHYADSRDIYLALIECLCENLDRLLGISGHLMFWYSAKHRDPDGRDTTLRMFRDLAPGLQFQPHPLIWVKSDNAGISPNPSRDPRHIYETCLLASRGSRNLVRIAGDAYSAPTDKRLHLSAKPEPVLKHFMSMLVDDTTSLLDPTCGSASSLRAAEELGAARVLGMDIDEQSVALARTALRNSRSLRGATRRAP